MQSDVLAGQTALITGAAGGIGQAHALLFANQGAHCVLCDISDDAGEALVDQIRGQGGSAEYHHLDASSQPDWSAVMDFLFQRQVSPSVLVNIAGITSPCGLDAETEDNWERLVNLNQKGVWLGMRAVMPLMAKSGGGVVVNIASMMGVISRPGALAYQATKAAVIQMTKAAALEYAEKGVRVNAVSPGMIKTPMLGNPDSEMRARQAQAVPVKRLGEADEVAQCSLFLCSPAASYVTGANLVVDGGVSAM